MNPNTIRVGDTVMARHHFGSAPAAPAIVEGLTITEYPRDKWGGTDVDSVPFKTIRENRCLFALRYKAAGPMGEDVTAWHYADQIDI